MSGRKNGTFKSLNYTYVEREYLYIYIYIYIYTGIESFTCNPLDVQGAACCYEKYHHKRQTCATWAGRRDGHHPISNASAHWKRCEWGRRKGEGGRGGE